MLPGRFAAILISVVAWMVRVKLGIDSRTGEAVAIKIMYKDNMTARAAQQLRREITSMKALNHPNILRLKDVHEVRIHYKHYQVHHKHYLV